MNVDVLIFGGGGAGLWLLDELNRRRFRALLVEHRALGAGQTIASQGILHGGLKYMLGGIPSRSTKAVAEMTELWRACLTGRGEPDLRGVRVLSPCCYLWRSESLVSRAALTAANLVLRTSVEKTAMHDRPAALADCPGEVLRVEEQVIDTASLLRVLADAHAKRIMWIGEEGKVGFSTSQPGWVEEVRLLPVPGGAPIAVRPSTIVFAAGEGNEELRRQVALLGVVMQRRPLHMVMVRGILPQLFGHCVHGRRTRVTITSVVDSGGRTVWQLGGEIAEKGVEMSPSDLVTFAKRELSEVLPGVHLHDMEWATYRINRAEGKSTAGLRPDGPAWRRDGSVITAWPTKLVLAPALARMIADSLGEPPREPSGSDQAPLDWPLPDVAQPPWETQTEWQN